LDNQFVVFRLLTSEPEMLGSQSMTQELRF